MVVQFDNIGEKINKNQNSKMYHNLYKLKNVRIKSPTLFNSNYKAR
jgi:hypothetical protein